MSLQARALQDENAGIRTAGTKNGEAPAKQLGAPKKGLSASTWNANQRSGTNQGLAPAKVQTKVMPKKQSTRKVVDDSPIEFLHVATGYSETGGDFITDSLKSLDTKSASVWGSAALGYDTDSYSYPDIEFHSTLDRPGPPSYEPNFLLPSDPIPHERVCFMDGF